MGLTTRVRNTRLASSCRSRFLARDGSELSPKNWRGLRPGESAHSGDHTAVILHVVVTVEDVVFPGVLVLGGHDNLAEPAPELGAGVHAVVLLGVGVSAPGGVDLGQVLHRLPVTLVQHRQDSGAVGAWLAAEYAVQALAPALIKSPLSLRKRARVKAFLGSGQVFGEMLDDVVVFG